MFNKQGRNPAIPFSAKIIVEHSITLWLSARRSRETLSNPSIHLAFFQRGQINYQTSTSTLFIWGPITRNVTFTRRPSQNLQNLCHAAPPRKLFFTLPVEGVHAKIIAQISLRILSRLDRAEQYSWSYANTCSRYVFSYNPLVNILSRGAAVQLEEELFPMTDFPRRFWSWSARFYLRSFPLCEIL